jgi:uncharacterized protein YdeI (YjbR/CyaY-like superfamily)
VSVASGAGSSAANAKFFASPARLRSWLEKHHADRTELWVGLYRKGTGRASVTWPELVDQLLCFGWIDGIRKSRDEESYVIRVTPRRAGSIWSAVNLKRVPQLIESGDMAPHGRAVYDARDRAKTNRYSFERANVAFDPALEAAFRKNRKAWSFFESQPPSYRKPATWWVMSAKREDTRRRRMDTLIRDSANGERIRQLRR